MLKVWSWNPTLLKAIEDRAKADDVAKVRIKKSPVVMLMDSDYSSLPQVELPKYEVIEEPPVAPNPIEPYYNDWPTRVNKKNREVVQRFYRLARSGNNYFKS